MGRLNHNRVQHDAADDALGATFCAQCYAACGCRSQRLSSLPIARLDVACAGSEGSHGSCALTRLGNVALVLSSS
jgi:hypothetical protein